MENEKRNSVFFTMDFSDVLFWILHWKWVIVVVTLFFAVLGYFFSNITYEPKYTASASMVVNSKAMVNGELVITNNSDSQTRLLMTTYEEVLASNKIYEYVVRTLGVNDSYKTIKSAVTITTAEETQVVYIEAEHVDPYMAKSIANATMECAPAIMLETVEKGSVNILDFATLPTNPSSPATVQYIITAALIGMLLAIFFIILVNFLTMKIKNASDIEYKLGFSVFGEIPHVNVRTEVEKSLLYTGKANMEFIESYFMAGAVLKNNVEDKHPYKIMVTSAVAGEGKTTTAINFATVMSNMGHKVLLIDMDLKKPSIAKKLNIDMSGKRGIAGVLGGESLESQIVGSGYGFDLLACVKGVNDSSRLLSSIRLKILFSELNASEYDYIIIDTAPAHIISDTSVIVKQADGVVMVIKQQYAMLRAIIDTITSLKKSGAKIIGAILNDVRVHNIGSGYSYGYKYGYKKRYGGYYTNSSNSSKKENTKKENTKEHSKKTDSDKKNKKD